MSKYVVIITIVIVGLTGSGTAVALNGSGTQEDPWLIQSLDDFNDFAADANYWAGFTRLETDVNLAGRVYERAVIAPDVSSSQYYQGTKYTGIFDGNDHKILNLTIDDGGAGNYWVGLFGYIDNGQVRNLGLEGGSVSASGLGVGGLVGVTYEGTISNCYSTGDVNGGGYVGGLMGSFGYSSVSNCYSTGDVSGTGDVIGGLVGYAFGIGSNCYSTGNVSGDGTVGGLIGSNQASISNCYSTGEVSGKYEVGGLVGWNDGSVFDCYSTGDVSGDNIVGGLVGSISGSYNNVFNCYSTGDVNGFGDVGGLVGHIDINGEISNCFWDTDIQTHGVTESFGVNDGTATNVSGLPTAHMQIRSTFTDAAWDFINVWNIGENQTYPYLRVYFAADLNKDGIVNFLDLSITANQWMEKQ